MGRSRHRITVSSYPSGSALLLFADARNELFSILALDSSNKIVQPVPIVDESDEIIYSSDVKDDYGNKDCYHAYTEMNGIVDAGAITGVTMQMSNTLSGPTATFMKGTTRLFSTYVPGKGTLGTSNSYYVVDFVSPTFFQKRYFIGEHHYYTYTAELLESTSGKYVDSRRTIKVKYTNKYTAWGKSTYGMIDDVLIQYQNSSPVYLGIIDGTKIPTKSQILLLLGQTHAPKVHDHYVPDNILDNIYEKLTIPEVNNIENLKDFREIRKSIPPIVNLLKRRNLRSMSELYLWYKYSFSTSKMDLKAYYTFFQKWLKDSRNVDDTKRTVVTYNQSENGSGMSSTTTTRYQIISDPFNIGVLRTLGLEINLGNTWDLLPFSFVVDWFINLGDILARLDHNETLSELHIRSVISSTKSITTSIPLIVLNCTSLCSTVYYRRSIDKTIPLGNLEVSLKNPGTHLLDGTALYVATKRS